MNTHIFSLHGISHQAPAEQGLRVIGNGLVRIPVLINNHSGSVVKFDVHYLPDQQDSGGTLNYTTLENQWCRVVAVIDDELYWLGAAEDLFPKQVQVLEPVPGRELSVSCPLINASTGALGPIVTLTFAVPDSTLRMVWKAELQPDTRCQSLGLFVVPDHQRYFLKKVTKNDVILSGIHHAPEIQLSTQPDAEAVMHAGDLGYVLHELAGFRGESLNPIPGGVLLSVPNGYLEIEFRFSTSSNGLVGHPPAQTVEFESQHSDLNRLYRHIVGYSRAACRADGQMSAGFFDAYEGSWIRDGSMDLYGLILAGDWGLAGRILTHLLEHVPPKRGQYEEYGMLLYGFWLYSAMTGEQELAQQHWSKLVQFADEPFQSDRWNPELGLLLSGTEGYWERDWLGEGYAMSQQVWMALGLACAAALAEWVGQPNHAQTWSALSEQLRVAIFENPTTRMVESGRFINRRNPDLTHQLTAPTKRAICRFSALGALPIPDVYRGLEGQPSPIEPDVQQVVPYLWGMVDPLSAESMATSEQVWELWNDRWDFGGMSRYNVLSDPDQETAGPWYFCGLMAARAFLLQDRFEQVDLITDWTISEGGQSFCWAERVAQAAARSRHDRYVNVGMTWTWGEWLLLLLREGCGLRPGLDGLRIAPHLPPSWGEVLLKNLRYQAWKYDLRYRGTGSRVQAIRFNGTPHCVTEALPRQSGEVEIELAP